MHFILAQGTHQETKANFVLLVEENCNWSTHPLPFYMSSSDTSKLFVYNYRLLTVTVYSRLSLR